MDESTRKTITAYIAVTAVLFGAVIFGIVAATLATMLPKQNAANKGCSIASQEKASALITRLLPNAKITASEPYPLTPSTCLLEVEMLADANNPQTKGFIYVLPDGEHLLNGPLMDKRSQLNVQGQGTQSNEVTALLETQKKALDKMMSQVDERKAAQDEQLKALTANPDRPIIAPPAEATAIPEASPAALAALQQQGKSAQQQRQELIERLQGLPTLVSGNGAHPVYVLLDPLCAYCRKLYAQSVELSNAHNISFHWIPMFQNEAGWALSAQLIKTQKESPEKALALLEKIMTKKATSEEISPLIKQLTESDFAEAKKAVAVFIELARNNPRIGTPLVIFTKANGEHEVISGLPSIGDWDGIDN